MKYKKILAFSSVFVLSAAGITFSTLLHRVSNKNIIEVKAISDTGTVTLKDNTTSEIVNYYSSLSGKDPEQLQGENLLKNLKTILCDGMSYYSFSDVSLIYLITDRDWVNSPIESFTTGSYNSTTKTLTGFSYATEKENNPYLKLLYYDGYQGNSYYTPIRYYGEGDVEKDKASFDKEHVWSQSHGFDDPATSAQDSKGPAGTDLHHLLASTQRGNRHMHSNESYGYVDVATYNDPDKYPYEQKNKRGTPLHTHEEDGGNVVFEPQDCDKGDIARALLYMVARYNDIGGSAISEYDPRLKLVDYIIDSGTSLSTVDPVNGYYGILSDILAWHYADPVDEYEIHRNNLIYNNYQHNRNPFIDYPEWVEYIWGTGRYNEINRQVSYNPTPTGYVDLSKDVINGYRDEEHGGGGEQEEEVLTSTLTITRSSFPETTTAFGEYDEWNQNGFSGMGDPGTYKSYMYFGKGSKVCLYNSTKLGFIKQIDINMRTGYSQADGQVDLYLGNSIRFSDDNPVGEKYATILVQNEGTVTINIETGNYTYFAISKPNVSNFNVDSFVIKYDNAEFNATKWANSFLSTTGAVCQNDGSTNFESLSSAWATLKVSYKLLGATPKTYFSGASTILDSDNATIINNMLARYRMICSKYNKISIQLEEFIDDVVINHSNRLLISNSLNLELIIYLSIGASLIGLSLALILRKRKHYNV